MTRDKHSLFQLIEEKLKKNVKVVFINPTFVKKIKQVEDFQKLNTINTHASNVFMSRYNSDCHKDLKC